MRNLLYIVVTTVILAACVGGGKERAVLDIAQRIINERPDSALAILDSLEPSSQKFSRPNLRRWQLLRLMAQNKCDTVFSDDSLQKELVKYYDHHGTPNERMTAHYLLGRAYSDMGEAPIAMEVFQDAVESADTTAANCDWWTLTRIYMHLAEEYYKAYLPHELLFALYKAEKTAMRAGDTITAFYSIAKRYNAYELLDDKDSMRVVTYKSADLLEGKGRIGLASSIRSVMIDDEAEEGNTNQAAKLIKDYEGFSGFFNSDHEIQKGLEIYYYIKGLYYLAVALPDSAEWMFRKLLITGNTINDRHAAYTGLCKLYSSGPYKDKDSLVKYAMLSASYNDSLYKVSYRANLHQFQHQYNYGQIKKKMMTAQEESAHKDHIIAIVVFSFIISSLVTLIIYLNRKRKRDLVLVEYKRDVKRLNELRIELLSMLNNKDKTISDYNQQKIDDKAELLRLSDENGKLRQRLSEALRHEQDMVNAKNEELKALSAKLSTYHIAATSESKRLYRELHDAEAWTTIQKAILKPDVKLSQANWEALDSLFAKVYPNFPTILMSANHLSLYEYRVCELIRMGVSPSDIARLLNYEKSNITNMRKRMFLKVTGKGGKAQDFDEFLFSIPSGK